MFSLLSHTPSAMRALLIAFLLLTTLQAQAQNQCAAAAQWTAPGSGRVEANEVLSRAARAQAVLLGESHENADHHRWQLQTMAALLALQPKMLIGFEMFPRRLQGVLDSWVAGEFGEQEFLRASEWNQVWGFDPALYLPLFHFARLNRIRMLALNVDNSLVRTVSLKGIAAIPLDKRENVSDPAPATEAYLNWLFPIYAEHRKGESSRNAPEFQLFVESQLLWDRALAQRLAEAAKAQPGTLVIGVMGSGHLLHGHGVPRQLKDLGIERVDTLLPWTPNQQCKDLTAGAATAVFGIPEPRPAAARPLLGISLETTADGLRVASVGRNSIAETAGVKEGDILVEVAGAKPSTAADVRAVVEAMAPGTWLPLKAKRGSDTIDLVARFPVRP